jgi:hypothetical protein
MLSDFHLTPENEAAISAGQGGPVVFGGSAGKYVVMRSDVYEAMLGIGDDSAEAALEAVKQGLADIDAGRFVDAEQFFDELARKYE